VLKVGLTGGIGCGKTTVSQLFKEMNVPAIDADDIAHSLVEPGQPALLEISKAFGDKAINPDGSLDRHYLRDTIFSNRQQKQQLEDILHPLVFAAMEKAIDQLNDPYCILSVPLLFETHMAHFVDRILVVDCPAEAQIARVRRRDGLDDVRIQSIIDSQASRDYRLAHADDIIDNSLASSELAEQAKKLHNLYLSISASSGQTRS
jgi:dephospho-CoA kinase